VPVYIGEVISLLKGTAVAGYISVQDLTKVSDIIRSRTYEAFFPLIATALIYFLLAWIIRQLLTMAMKRINPRFKGGKKA
jgi:polar amino acid transport system substrate-binding protein